MICANIFMVSEEAVFRKKSGIYGLTGEKIKTVGQTS